MKRVLQNHAILRIALILLMPVLNSCSVSAEEQTHKVYRIAFVGATSPSTFPRSISAFWDRLRELVYVEGQNLIIESRWAEGHPQRLPALMSEMVRRKVDVIITYKD